MPAPEQLTAYDASSPASPPELLARIAEHRPDLRPLVAANPATPSGVLARLATLGDVAVDAALARRSQQGASGSTDMAAPAGSNPYQAPTATGHAAPGASGYGGFAAPGAGGYAAPGAGGFGGYVPPGGGGFGGYAAPGPGYPGTAGPGQDPYAAGTYGPAYGTHGPAYGQASAPTAWGAAPKRSRSPWIVVVIVAVLLAVTGLSVVGYYVVRGAVTAVSDNATYGSDEELDALWDACDAGDGQACDDLFWDAPPFSEYEDFGNTCGGREPGGFVWCAEADDAGTA